MQQPPSPSAGVDWSSCSALQGDCIRIGVFYCSKHTLAATLAVHPHSYDSLPNCAQIRGYNALLDWYALQHVVVQLGGLIANTPVRFVPLVLPQLAPSGAQLAALVNATFFAEDFSAGAVAGAGQQ